MQMQNLGSNFNISPQVVSYQSYSSSPHIKLVGLTQDVFERNIPQKDVHFGAWPKVFSQVDGVTKDSLGKLSRVEINHLFQLAKSNIDEKLVDDIMRFTSLIKDGLDKKFGSKHYVFVSIGQSPAVIAEALGVQGVETAICPISKLGKLNNVNNILKNPKINSYFEYLKKIGLDPNKIKRDNRQYIFVDYTVTGKSLKRFEELLKSKNGGFNLPNVKFISLQDILKSHTFVNKKELDFVDDFIQTAIHERKLKDYSPIFKLPVEDIHNVQKYRDETPANERLNMLKFLMMHKAYA